MMMHKNKIKTNKSKKKGIFLGRYRKQLEEDLIAVVIQEEIVQERGPDISGN
jgi:hypothetical protein